MFQKYPKGYRLYLVPKDQKRTFKYYTIGLLGPTDFRLGHKTAPIPAVNWSQAASYYSPVYVILKKWGYIHKSTQSQRVT